MRKQQKQKVMAIVALCISILGLTLGFAAFSNTLTISSSATVSPDDADFDINVYGVESTVARDDIYNEEVYTSTTTSSPWTENDGKEKTPIKIIDNGKSITISDISVGLVEPGDSVTYNFLIKNEGEYDAYIDTSLFDRYFSGDNIGCTPGDGATPELVENACKWIVASHMFMNYQGNHIESGEVYKLAKGDYILLDILIFYVKNQPYSRADGEFSVEFPDVTLEFSSVPPSE